MVQRTSGILKVRYRKALKSGIERLYELLRQIFERCLNGDKVPTDLKIGHISVIHKKGKNDGYEN